MRTIRTLLSLALAALAHCQTATALPYPSGTQPETQATLTVTWNGQHLAPGQLLHQTLLMAPPGISLNQNLTQAGPFMIALVDLSIPIVWLPNSTDLANADVGLSPTMTTWLRWLQTGFVQAKGGSFSSNATPIAQYGYPNPSSTDHAHTYAFYLFPEIATGNRSLPGADAGRDLSSTDAPARINFSIQDLTERAGFPVAANWFIVSTNASPESTASSGANNTGTPASGRTATATSSGAVYTGGAGVMKAAFGLVAVMGLAGVGAIVV